MNIDPSEPLYLSLPRPQWERTQKAGDISGQLEFTNSMRLAEKDAAGLANLHPDKIAMMLKLDAEAMLRDHGQPMQYLQKPERHHDDEYSISWLKHRIEQFLKYVVGVIEVEADALLGDDPDHVY